MCLALARSASATDEEAVNTSSSASTVASTPSATAKDEQVPNALSLASTNTGVSSPAEETLTPGVCDRILQDLCLACLVFSLRTVVCLVRLVYLLDNDLTSCSGGDVHVSTDGNRHHRRLKGAGEGPAFYRPKHFVSKDFID